MPPAVATSQAAMRTTGTSATTSAEPTASPVQARRLQVVAQRPGRLRSAVAASTLPSGAARPAAVMSSSAAAHATAANMSSLSARAASLGPAEARGSPAVPNVGSMAMLNSRASAAE